MPADPDGIFLLAIILLSFMLLLSLFYSTCESAVVNASESQIKKKADAGDKRALQVDEFLEKQNRIISSLHFGLITCGLFGLGFASYAFIPVIRKAFSFAGADVLKFLLSGLIVFLLYAFVFYTFFYLIPAKLARRNATAFTCRSFGLIQFLSALAKPLLVLCDNVSNGILRVFGANPHLLDDTFTEEEILFMVDEGQEKGIIDKSESEMISNILDFNDKTAEEMMTHRTDVTAVSDEDSIEDILTASVEKGYSRLPVYHEDIDSIVGICYIKDLLPYVGREIPEFIQIKDIMRPVYFVPETKKGSQLFTEMTERKVQIAVVVDEYGGTSGIITLEDLMESIFGNIQDEYDNEEEEIRRMSENEFSVDGTTSIDEISDLTGYELPEGDYDTIAGFVMEKLGYIPEEKEYPSIEEGPLAITVTEVEDQRLSKLLIIKNEMSTLDEAEDE